MPEDTGLLDRMLMLLGGLIALAGLTSGSPSRHQAPLVDVHRVGGRVALIAARQV
jgi:hypothetical protein